MANSLSAGNGRQSFVWQAHPARWRKNSVQMASSHRFMQYKTIEDDHEPIVSKELWQKVQDRLNSYSKHKTQGSYFLKGKVYCGECGCLMRRISYLYHNVRQKVWQCSDRFKGKKGNGCENEIISEEDLIILLSETLGVPYNGLDNLNPDDYECIYKVTIYKNGEIQLEYK